MFISSATGLALVWGNPLNYVTNIIFWLKMLAMVARRHQRARLPLHHGIHRG
jgi:hypothetical protein